MIKGASEPIDSSENIVLFRVIEFRQAQLKTKQKKHTSKLVFTTFKTYFILSIYNKKKKLSIFLTST